MAIKKSKFLHWVKEELGYEKYYGERDAKSWNEKREIARRFERDVHLAGQIIDYMDKSGVFAIARPDLAMNDDWKDVGGKAHPAISVWGMKEFGEDARHVLELIEDGLMYATKGYDKNQFESKESTIRGLVKSMFAE